MIVQTVHVIDLSALAGCVTLPVRNVDWASVGMGRGLTVPDPMVKVADPQTAPFDFFYGTIVIARNIIIWSLSDY